MVSSRVFDQIGFRNSRVNKRTEVKQHIICNENTLKDDSIFNKTTKGPKLSETFTIMTNKKYDKLITV